MRSLVKRVIHINVIAIIDGTVKRLPVRGEFMLHRNEEGRLALAWQEMSMHKLHRFLDLLIHDIQGSAEAAFVSPQKEATDFAIDFAEKLKYMNIGEYAKDSQKLTRVMAEARLHFSTNNQRLKQYISDPGNSQVVVFGIFTHLKKSTVTDAERLRNEQIMRLLEIMKIVSPQFPTVPNELGYFEFLHKCETMIEHLIKAFKAQLLFAMPALTEALHMSEKELQKKLSHVCSTPNPKPYGGGANPKPHGGGGKGIQPSGSGSGRGRGTGNPIGTSNPRGNPQGNNAKATFGGGGGNPFTGDGTRKGKRDSTGNQKTSSTGATDNSASTPTPKGELVPCKVCGGFHSSKSHEEYGTGFKCPYQRNGHPHINMGPGEFLDSENGKQYALYP
jgi:hypothetical protein